MPKKRQKKKTCCEKCQNYWSCETKWYRGENNIESVCCSECAYYTSCWDTSAGPRKRSRKILTC